MQVIVVNILINDMFKIIVMKLFKSNRKEFKADCTSFLIGWRKNEGVMLKVKERSAQCKEVHLYISSWYLFRHFPSGYQNWYK